MKRIAICVKSLVALLNIAGKDGIRSYIIGILLEPVGEHAHRPAEGREDDDGEARLERP